MAQTGVPRARAGEVSPRIAPAIHNSSLFVQTHGSLGLSRQTIAHGLLTLSAVNLKRGFLLGGFRTPAAEYAAPSFQRPASETLHISSNAPNDQNISAWPSEAGIAFMSTRP